MKRTIPAIFLVLVLIAVGIEKVNQYFNWNIILIIALASIPILLGIIKSPKVALIGISSIGIALFFNNIDKFQRFKGAGIEAELRTVVNEAYAAIEQLRELGISLSRPIVDELAVSGRMLQYIPLKQKLERVENIANTLEKLGASKSEIEEVTYSIYNRVINDHKRWILRSLKKSNPGKETLFKGLDEGKMDDWDQEKIEAFIKGNNLVKNEETDEWFLDLEYFLKNRKLRREDKWQS